MAHASGTPPTSHPRASGGRARPRKGPLWIALEVVLWALQLYLAYFMVTTGAIPALTADPGAKETFQDIGFGLWFMYLTGTLELLGAIALLTPWTAGLAALGLMGVMAGAVTTHLTLYDGRGVETPAMILIPLALVALGRRSNVTSLLNRLRGGGRR
ncbi:DoxX family protein [Streptomyces albidus (ex Kaewkla and Franco 2022)]|uniref:DoxX family protein n=1 Tax=Streptomyces albidus (ex Kaewkla and Franco 2022) TaxID=722709 RepID=UPI0015EEC12B|nr:DoxX family protein [Streptomyces albidus (ex Kaewkla and Franco 2022)]